MSGVRYEAGRDMPPGMQEQFAVQIVQQLTEAAPSVDAVEVWHGRWEKYARYMICSECDIGFCYYKNETDRFRYCPNCGAKMDGERKYDVSVTD